MVLKESSVQNIKKQICNDDNPQLGQSEQKAYDLYLQEARKQRKVDEKTRHVIALRWKKSMISFS